MIRISIAATSLILLGWNIAAAQPTEDQFSKLNWKVGAGTHVLLQSNATVRTRPGEAFLEGKDAWEAMRLMEGHDRFKPDAMVLKLEGVLRDSLITFQYNSSGYLKMDDWEEHIQPDDLLETIKRNTEEANETRARGYSKLYVDGWSEQPYLDRNKAIVFWAVRGHTDEGDRFINARALKLGRKGFSVITWAGSPDQFGGASQTLTPALNAYRYDTGFRYADFKPGIDTVAAVGVGAVAYKMLTGTSKKTAGAIGAGILAIIAAFAKKLWFLIFVPLIFAWKWIRRSFTRNKT